MKKEQVKKAYDSVIRAIKRSNGLVDATVADFEFRRDRDLLKIELQELGFPNVYIGNLNYFDLFNNIFKYVHFKPQNDYTISWSDDGRQPENERLIEVSFSTGPYIFGEQYDKVTFQEFFEELKGFGYEYIDSNNKSIFYSLEVGGKVYAQFKDIFNKYLDLSKERNKEAKIKELQKQIDELS